MTPDQLRTIIEGKGLRRARAASLLAIKVNALYHYLSGHRRIPEPVAELARRLDADTRIKPDPPPIRRRRKPASD